MSVRRLGSVQPDSFAFTPDNLSWAKATIAKYPEGKQASAVIPLLWRAQEQNAGWTSRAAMEYVAQLLGMAYIRVYEVATFYTMFQLSPVGVTAHLQVCGTTPCMLRGAEELKAVCQRKIHNDPHHLSADGAFSWEEVECLGACVNAPIVQIWKDTYEDLTPATFEKLIDDLAAGRPIKPGPQVDRQLSAPQGGLTTLTDKSLFNGTRTFKRQEPPPPPAATVPAAPAVSPPAPVPPAPVVVATPAPAVATLASVEVPVKVAKKSVASKVAAPKAMPAAKRTRGEPEQVKRPRHGRADDLKLIWGIGPKLEKMLNGMGIWHFDQVAAWTKSELKWVDQRLEGFKGRAQRDDWIRQAKKLAKGWRPDNAVGEKPK